MKLKLLFLLTAFVLTAPLYSRLIAAASSEQLPKSRPYAWTTDHLQIGVRWQPFGLPGCELYDANRPLISKHSSYAQFWVSWNAVEPDEKNTDYKNHMSGHLQSIENAVNLCIERGVKVEFVMWHTPRWASVSGNAGPWRPKTGLHIILRQCYGNIPSLKDLGVLERQAVHPHAFVVYLHRLIRTFFAR